MSFKDQVAKDIDGVFLNPIEFAEPHDIDGVTTDCVLDDDIIEPHSGDDQSMEYDGVFFTDKMLYIKEGFFTERPIEGQRIYVDGDQYDVIKVSANMGLLEIRIRQYST